MIDEEIKGEETVEEVVAAEGEKTEEVVAPVEEKTELSEYSIHCMSTLTDARMSSLKDKHLAQAEEDAKNVEEVAEEKEKEDEEERKRSSN